MISVVVVSHSEALAAAAVELALQMVRGDQPKIAIAAGAGAGIIGTDAVRVAHAIDAVATPDGVLVLVDLGSAVLSAELALEFTSTDAPVVISAAPFVEGLIAAVVTAAGGASLADVEREALAALGAKLSALGGDPTSEVVPAGGATTARVTLTNQDGLHARPAALIVHALGKADAVVTIALAGGIRVNAKSLIGLLSLGARAGDVLVIESSGADSADALAQIRELVDDNFGEPSAG